MIRQLLDAIRCLDIDRGAEGWLGFSTVFSVSFVKKAREQPGDEQSTLYWMDHSTIHSIIVCHSYKYLFIFLNKGNQDVWSRILMIFPILIVPHIDSFKDPRKTDYLSIMDFPTVSWKTNKRMFLAGTVVPILFASCNSILVNCVGYFTV